MIALDTETTGLAWWKDELFGIAHCQNAKNYGFGLIEKLNQDELKRLMRSDSHIVFHNAKFDLHFLKKLGYKIPKHVDDTMIMSALVNENGSHRLQDVAVRYLNIPKWKDGVVDYVKKHKCTYKEVPHNIMKEYAANDALRTWQIAQVLYPILTREGVKELYDSEMKLLIDMLEIEERGFLINTKYLKQLSKQLEAEEKMYIKQVYHEAGEVFNVNSDDEIARILFDKLKLPIQGYTFKERKPKTDEYTLKKLNHPIIQPILNYRIASHMRSTYCDNLHNFIGSDNILHTNFKQHGTVTGRFSCVEPNLQNIPKDHAVRELFICRPDYYIFSFDYKQEEMRLYAHYANDKQLMEMFDKELDPYMEMSKIYYNRSNIKKHERDFIKGFTLGILYGMGARGISTRYNKTMQEAWNIKRHYEQAFPSMKRFSYHVTDKIKHDGFIRNVFGRKRRLSYDKAYKGLNSLIQGTGGDIMKQSIHRVHELLKPTKSNILNSIHDDLMVEIYKSETHLISKIIKIMEDFPQFSVKLPVDVKYTNTNWREVKSYDIQRFNKDRE